MRGKSAALVLSPLPTPVAFTVRSFLFHTSCSTAVMCYAMGLFPLFGVVLDTKHTQHAHTTRPILGGIGGSGRHGQSASRSFVALVYGSSILHTERTGCTLSVVGFKFTLHNLYQGQPHPVSHPQEFFTPSPHALLSFRTCVPWPLRVTDHSAIVAQTSLKASASSYPWRVRC